MTPEDLQAQVSGLPLGTGLNLIFNPECVVDVADLKEMLKAGILSATPAVHLSVFLTAYSLNWGENPGGRTISVCTTNMFDPVLFVERMAQGLETLEVIDNSPKAQVVYLDLSASLTVLVKTTEMAIDAIKKDASKLFILATKHRSDAKKLAADINASLEFGIEDQEARIIPVFTPTAVLKGITPYSDHIGQLQKLTGEVVDEGDFIEFQRNYQMAEVSQYILSS